MSPESHGLTSLRSGSSILAMAAGVSNRSGSVSRESELHMRMPCRVDAAVFRRRLCKSHAIRSMRGSQSPFNTGGGRLRPG